MPKTVMARLPHGQDLVSALEQLAQAHGVRKGTIQVIGALKGAMLGFFDQESRRFVTHPVPCPVEIASGQGNVSVMDGRPMVHLHLVVAGENAACLGGHALPGCVVHAVEAFIQECAGEDLERGPDPETGLSLWPLSPGTD